MEWTLFFGLLIIGQLRENFLLRPPENVFVIKEHNSQKPETAVYSGSVTPLGWSKSMLHKITMSSASSNYKL